MKKKRRFEAGLRRSRGTGRDPEQDGTGFFKNPFRILVIPWDGTGRVFSKDHGIAATLVLDLVAGAFRWVGRAKAQ